MAPHICTRLCLILFIYTQKKYCFIHLNKKMEYIRPLLFVFHKRTRVSSPFCLDLISINCERLAPPTPRGAHTNIYAQTKDKGHFPLSKSCKNMREKYHVVFSYLMRRMKVRRRAFYCGFFFRIFVIAALAFILELGNQTEIVIL